MPSGNAAHFRPWRCLQRSQSDSNKAMPMLFASSASTLVLQDSAAAVLLVQPHHRGVLLQLYSAQQQSSEDFRDKLRVVLGCSARNHLGNVFQILFAKLALGQSVFPSVGKELVATDRLVHRQLAQFMGDGVPRVVGTEDVVVPSIPHYPRRIGPERMLGVYLN